MNYKSLILSHTLSQVKFSGYLRRMDYSALISVKAKWKVKKTFKN